MRDVPSLVNLGRPKTRSPLPPVELLVLPQVCPLPPCLMHSSDITRKGAPLAFPLNNTSFFTYPERPMKSLHPDEIPPALLFYLSRPLPPFFCSRFFHSRFLTRVSYFLSSVPAPHSAFPPEFSPPWNLIIPAAQEKSPRCFFPFLCFPVSCSLPPLRLPFEHGPCGSPPTPQTTNLSFQGESSIGAHPLPEK